MSGAAVFDARRCHLGEGPLWHPARGQLLWFDITERTLMASDGTAAQAWPLDEMASAAGLTDDPDRLLIATETGLALLHLATGAAEPVCAIEADRPETRSNDGRADPWGGFWIGTMAKSGHGPLGAIYRWHEGELRRLRAAVSVPNAICFDRGRAAAFFTDTPTQVILRQPLHPDTGWPEGEAVPHIDLGHAGHHPDGAVVDADGCLWNARWGSGRVVRHDPDGRPVDVVPFPATNTTCPAFGGPDGTTLFCTSAQQGLSPERRRDEAQGRTYAALNLGPGLPEPRVAL